MANEHTTQVSVAVRNGTLSRSFSKNATRDQTTARAIVADQVVGTTHELLFVSDLTLAEATIYNPDDTNYLEIGIDNAGSFVAWVKVSPGAVRVVEPPSGVVYYVRANTAPITIEGIFVST